MTVKLVIFDVDGTILQNSSWQHIHHNLNTWSQAKKHSDQFFRNEITYEQWAKLDAALWKNQPLARINQLIKGMPYTKGAKETLVTLKSKGLKVYLLSAGLTRVAHRIQSETWVDGSTANTLIVEDGCLTGEVEVNVSFYNKNKHLRPILQKFHLEAKETAAIGDDPTLIPLFEKVAFSIAFNPVDRSVEKSADIAINSNDLRDVLPYILEQG
ncbi:MAG: HAD family phosphatase [Candidatus Bathyarchaeota archaeon]|nr:MAG: HAD family phosphatase [Candidatus Bathyarchaeota archaeon]